MIPYLSVFASITFFKPIRQVPIVSIILNDAFHWYPIPYSFGLAEGFPEA